MTETRKLAAILVADVVGYSRLAGAHEERTLARLRGLIPKRRGNQPAENGSRTDTPVAETAATLRVTSVSPCTFAVAANRPSISGSGFGTPMSAQASVIGSSTGRTRFPSKVRICANH